MLYEGPQPIDFDDVSALNRTFLKQLQRVPDAERHLRGLREDLLCRLRSLSGNQLKRLARAPFLLFSFREHDRRFWDRVHGDHPQADLLTGARPSMETGQLIAAGLGFVWQLARQNPYVLRLICGASVHWCERIAARPLVDVIERAAVYDDLMTLRCALDANIWSKLLFNGVSRCDDVRLAAQLSALQMMLTHANGEPATVWASAACRTRVPALRLTGEGGQ